MPPDPRTTLHAAVQSGGTATRAGIAVEDEAWRLRMVPLTMEPLRHGHRDDPPFLVPFADAGTSLHRAEAQRRVRRDDGTGPPERALRETRERLLSLIGPYPTAREDPRSSNGELVSMNAQPQRVNAALQNTVEPLARSTGAMRNPIESTGVAAVVLDADPRSRRFAPAVAAMSDIPPWDRGRPIADLAARIDMPEPTAELAALLGGGPPRERRVDKAGDGAHRPVQLSPWRGTGHRPGGVVLRVVDVTSPTRAEDRPRILIAELRHRTRHLPTVPQAMPTLALGRGGTLKALSDRLAALGRVPGLPNTSGREAPDLRELVRPERQAHAAAEDGRVPISGPPVTLTLERVQALALHEQATDATQSGALRQDGARLHIGWQDVADAAGRL